MRLGGDGREGEFGKRLGNTHDSFQLTDCDGDRGAGVCFYLGVVDLATDRDKVRGELLSCFGTESRSAATLRG